MSSGDILVIGDDHAEVTINGLLIASACCASRSSIPSITVPTACSELR